MGSAMIQAGLRQGLITARQYGHINKFGRNIDVDAAEDVWGVGGDVPTQTAETVVDVVSGQAADDLGSTGAEYVTVEGWNLAGAYVTDTIEMDGLTNNQGTVPMAGINRAYVSQAGSGKVNAGAITLSNFPVTVTLGSIAAGESQTQQAAFFVAAGMTGLVSRWWAYANAGSPAATIIDLALRVYTDGVWRTLSNAGVVSDGNNQVDHAYGRDNELVVPSSTLFVVRVTAVGAANCDVSAGFDMSLFHNIA